MCPRGNLFRINTSFVVTALLVFTIAFPSLAVAQKGEEQPQILIEAPADNLAPAPIFISGNPNCATLNASSDPAFAHIVENYELKLNFGSPNGQYFFNTGQPGVVLTGPADPTKSVSVSSSAGNVFNWSSNKQITAVIVKGGPNANAYPYPPFSFGGNPDGFGLTTPNNGAFDISHVSFCFNLPLVPSAANAIVSGRVLDANSNPIRGAQLQLWNVSRGETVYAYTNNFGYYTFYDLPVADFYVLTATHGRFTFFDNTRSFTLENDLAGLDFHQSF